LYLPGALVLAKSLRKSRTLHKIIILICGGVSPDAIAQCELYFDGVVRASLLRSVDIANLNLLGRPELDVTFSKLHVFNPALFPYDRLCFLDSDVLVLKEFDSVFSYLDDDETVFAAAPDIGWPDAFNSGVFCFKPSSGLYAGLVSHADQFGSFDG
jgi:glycogenin